MGEGLCQEAGEQAAVTADIQDGGAEGVRVFGDPLAGLAEQIPVVGGREDEAGLGVLVFQVVECGRLLAV